MELIQQELNALRPQAAQGIAMANEGLLIPSHFGMVSRPGRAAAANRADAPSPTYLCTPLLTHIDPVDT